MAIGSNNPGFQTHPGRLNWLKIRWAIIFLGVILIISGQWHINRQTVPESPPTELGIWLNKDLFLADVGVDNILNALLLFIPGGILLAVGLQGIPLLPEIRIAFENKAASILRLLSQWPWLLIASGAFGLLMLRVNSDNFSGILVPVWITSLILFAFVMGKWDHQRQADLSPHLRRSDLLWMIGLMFAAILIGVYRLQGWPDQLMGDEGNFWTIGRDLARGLFKPSMFSPGVYTFPMFSSIIQSWFLRLFGVDLWGWRFGSVMMGVITIPPLYLLTRETYGHKVAIVSSIVMATNPYFIDFSRIGYPTIQSLFFTTLNLYWLYIGVHRKSFFYIFLAGVMAGLGFYTFFAARMSIVISLAFIAAIWVTKKISFKELLLFVVVLGLGFTIAAAPYIAYGSKVDPQGMSYKVWESVFFNSFNGLQFYTEKEIYAAAPPISINGNILFYNPQIYLVLITRGLARTLLALQRDQYISEHYVAFPLTGSIGALFYLIGITLTFSRMKQPRNLLLLLWFFANVLGLSALNTVPPRHTHMPTIIPVLAIFTGLGIYAFALGMAAVHRKLKKFEVLFIALIAILVAAGGINDFFRRAPTRYHAFPDQVMSWAGLISKDEVFIYLYTNPIEKNFKPYVMQEFRNDIPYEAISAQEVLNGKKIFTDQPTVIFYPIESATQIDPILKKQWGKLFISRVFFSTGGTPVLAAGMNTPFVFERDKTFLSVLLDSYGRRSLWSLLILLTVCFSAFAFFPSKWILIFPAQFRRWTDWVNTPEQELIPARADSDADLSEEIQTASITMEEQINEPPEWAQELEGISPINLPSSIARIQTRYKSVRAENSTDYYFQLHLPNIKFLSFLSPWLNQSRNLKEAINLPHIDIPDVALILLPVLTAIIAQILILNQMIWIGVFMYTASVISLSIWAYYNKKWRNVFANQLQLNRYGEKFLLLLTILLTIWTRFLDINTRVYGLELNETKWTVQSWYSAILRTNTGEFASTYYNYFPLDFWVRSIFIRIFGINFISARIESAVLSLIAVIFLYLLVRILTSNPSVALLTSLLYSFSYIEINAAHQALHNIHSEVWIFISLFFLFLAIRDRKLWQFQTAGILLGLGMLTSETFYPCCIAALAYIFALTIYEIKNKHASIRTWAKNLTLVIWPITIAYIGFTSGYLAEHHYNLLGLFQDPANSTQGLLDSFHFIWKNSQSVLILIFSHNIWTDPLFNWSGPLLNPLLLPFIIIGLIYNLWNIRRSYFAFIPLWFIFYTLPAPTLFESAWPRIMFFAIAPLITWSAFGLWVSLAALRTIFKNQGLRTTIATFGFILTVILINDYRIFKNELIDTQENQKRRELSDLVMVSAESTPLLLFPYLANQYDIVETETHILQYSIAGARGLGLDATDHFKQIEMNLLLPNLWQFKNTDGLDIIFDKTANGFTEERKQYLQVALSCYPQAEASQQGKFFDVYHINSQALQFPHCYSAIPPLAIAPKERMQTSGIYPITFQWDVNNLPIDSFTFKLERKKDNIFWIEVEDFFQGAGWYPENKFVNNFNGTGFLLDDWQTGEASYSFSPPRSDQYRIWIRYYKRLENDQQNFISVNGQATEYAENGSPLNEWVWKDIGSFEFQTVPTPISLSRSYGKDEQYSIFIDTIVITPNLKFQPDREDDIWQSVISTNEITSNSNQYSLMDILPGEYRWRVRIYDGNKLVDLTNKRGIESKSAFFIVP